MKATLLVLVAGCGSVMSANPAGDDDDHPPGTLSGSVLDERGDTIDFSTGEPVHTHAGPAIDIASGCPAVWKYTYLAGEQAPVFGKETTPNPLAWHIDGDDVAYRVRRDDGVVLLDWTAASGGDIVLHRDGAHAVAELGETLTMYLDARVGGPDGAIQSACWHNEPLAAPIAMSAPIDGELFAMSLPADSPISTVITSSASVAVFPFVQPTAEPVRMSLAVAEPSGTMMKLVKSAYVRIGAATLEPGPCDDTGCDQPSIEPTGIMSDGVLAGTWSLTIEDAVSGDAICDDHGLAVACVIPARLENEPAHPYRAVVRLGNESSLSVGAGTSEFTAATVSYTGLAPVQFYRCDEIRPAAGHTYCHAASTYAHVVALDRASVQFSPIDMQMRTAAGMAAGIVPSYLAPGALTFGARAWDAGDEGL